MIRLRRLAPVFALAAAIVFSTGLVQGQNSDRVKTVGKKLMCMCGCNQILTECNHIDCPLSVPMLKEVNQRIATGEADDLIVQAFIQQYGEKVLSEPPAHGFGGVAWAIPSGAFALGLALVFVVIRLWRRRVPVVPAPSSGPAISAETLERARRQADRETDD